MTAVWCLFILLAFMFLGNQINEDEPGEGWHPWPEEDDERDE